MPIASRLRRLTAFPKSQSFRRHGSTAGRSSFRTRNVLPPREQPTVTNEDKTKTLRTRQHGNRELPLPPLMDPLAVEAKQRHKRPKPLRIQGQMTDFQKELASNPYARILASPVRQCQFTNARLPSDLLQRFSSVHTPTPDGSGRLDAKILPRSIDATPEDGVMYGPSSSYVINDRQALKRLNVGRQWTQLLSERLKLAYDTKAAGRKASSSKKWYEHWQRDPKMPDTVLQNLKSDVIRAVAAIIKHKDDARLVMPVAALQEFASFAWLPANTTELGEDVANSFKDFTAHVVIPTYRLQDLLGVDELPVLPFEEDVAKLGHAAVVPHESTTKLNVRLRKLCSYLSDEQSERLASVSRSDFAALTLENAEPRADEQV
ncbi:uncharacterized protein LTR77_003026 [Saxophila tyrrhenica]|uniref:Uncharacterized protein n=1 Tax=Saxophila tyrrhenica TaxID=1690608 RepID=A0AAV9PG99_9PEZI|nr:hypothetical protein LTR77_003026 [Saxophila tyrrhenica]